MTARIVANIGYIMLCMTVVHSICLDGKMDANEECDDGNRYNQDGCNIHCKLENEVTFLCNATMGSKTECCPRHTNPYTLKDVCHCEDTVQPPATSGWTVTPNCVQRDIDECNTNNGECLREATCININVINDMSTTTHTCTCPPNMIGDGTILCI
jgi:cysteine-rich repeat protein